MCNHGQATLLFEPQFSYLLNLFILLIFGGRLNEVMYVKCIKEYFHLFNKFFLRSYSVPGLLLTFMKTYLVWGTVLRASYTLFYLILSALCAKILLLNVKDENKNHQKFKNKADLWTLGVRKGMHTNEKIHQSQGFWNAWRRGHMVCTGYVD